MNEAPTADGGPGFLAFLAFFLLAIALWFLMRNMNARMRRMSYRQQAAHRTKDEAQAGPGDLDTEDDGPVQPQARSRGRRCGRGRRHRGHAIGAGGPGIRAGRRGERARARPRDPGRHHPTTTCPAPGADRGDPSGVRRLRGRSARSRRRRSAP